MYSSRKKFPTRLCSTPEPVLYAESPDRNGQQKMHTSSDFLAVPKFEADEKKNLLWIFKHV